MIALPEWTRAERGPGRPKAKAVAALLRGQLTREERLVLILMYDEGLTTAEAAEALELSEAAVCEIHDELIRRVKAIGGPKTDAA